MPGKRLNAADRFRATKLVEELHQSGTLPKKEGYSAVGKVVAYEAGLNPELLRASVTKGLLTAAGVDVTEYTAGGSPISTLHRKLAEIEERITALEELTTTKEAAQ